MATGTVADERRERKRELARAKYAPAAKVGALWLLEPDGEGDMRTADGSVRPRRAATGGDLAGGAAPARANWPPPDTCPAMSECASATAPRGCGGCTTSGSPGAVRARLSGWFDDCWDERLRLAA